MAMCVGDGPHETGVRAGRGVEMGTEMDAGAEAVDVMMDDEADGAGDGIL
jgi:hypothetical protein